MVGTSNQSVSEMAIDYISAIIYIIAIVLLWLSPLYTMIYQLRAQERPSCLQLQTLGRSYGVAPMKPMNDVMAMSQQQHQWNMGNGPVLMKSKNQNTMEDETLFN